MSDSFFDNLKEESERDSYRKKAELSAAKAKEVNLDLKVAPEELEDAGEGRGEDDEMEISKSDLSSPNKQEKPTTPIKIEPE